MYCSCARRARAGPHGCLGLYNVEQRPAHLVRTRPGPNLAEAIKSMCSPRDDPRTAIACNKHARIDSRYLLQPTAIACMLYR